MKEIEYKRETASAVKVHSIASDGLIFCVIKKQRKIYEKTSKNAKIHEIQNEKIENYRKTRKLMNFDP